MPIIDLTDDRVPPGQQLVARAKWPIIGEREPAEDSRPWRLQLAGAIQNPLTLTLDELQSLPQTSLHMDIHCVTRWSRQKMTFTGVLLADLIAQVVPKSEAKFVSFISRSTRRHSTSLAIQVARELQTLIAYEFDGQSLPTDHGGPIRNIVPGRYFYKSVKWLETIEFLHVDRLGYWEAQSGYHNNADYLREERYMAPTLDKHTALKLIESRDFSKVDLRSIDASERDLSELNAKNALLRDANFRKSNLSRANFTDANMSNAHLEDSDLRNAVVWRVLDHSN